MKRQTERQNKRWDKIKEKRNKQSRIAGELSTLSTQLLSQNAYFISSVVELWSTEAHHPSPVVRPSYLTLVPLKQHAFRIRLHSNTLVYTSQQEGCCHWRCTVSPLTRRWKYLSTQVVNNPPTTTILLTEIVFECTPTSLNYFCLHPSTWQHC